MRVDRKCFAFALMLVAAVIRIAAPAHAATPTATPSPPNAFVEEPRAFGHVIGDIVTRRVLLALDGAEFVPATLPTPGPAGIWLERHAVRIESDPQRRRWLAIDYQIMNSPQTLTVVTLPAWKLASKNERAELSVGAWSISVAPLTPRKAFDPTGLGDLRPDRRAPLVALAPLRRGLGIGVTGLLASILAWGGWWGWRNWRAASNQPFAVALRQMRGLDESAPQAWHALHRAFDRTAGRAARAENLAALFERAPQLQPLRPAIERFFAQSGAWFFGGERPAHPVAVRALCVQLRRIEKRHER